MYYTSRIWNRNYLNYDMILPRDRKLRKLFHFIVVPFILAYMIICLCLISVTLMVDTYRILRLRYQH